MTVIAVKIYKDRVEIGSDSQTTIASNKIADAKKDIYMNANKIIEVNGMVIGCAGRVVGNALMSVFAVNHKPKDPSEAGLIEFLVEFESWAQTKDKDYRVTQNAFIVIIDDKVFEVQDGLLVREVYKYAALGSGAFLALGALYYDKTVEEAVLAAIEFDLYCSGTATIIIVKRNI